MRADHDLMRFEDCRDSMGIRVRGVSRVGIESFCVLLGWCLKAPDGVGGMIGFASGLGGL
jgi:hypothetical protein